MEKNERWRLRSEIDLEPAHIAGKNVLIFGVCSIVYWAVGFGIAFGERLRVSGAMTTRFFSSMSPNFTGSKSEVTGISFHAALGVIELRGGIQRAERRLVTKSAIFSSSRL